MLHQIEIELSLPEGQHINPNMGSIFHGIIMEKAGPAVASLLHDNSSARPFTQGVYFDYDSKTPIWRLNALNKDADDNVLSPIMQCIGEEVFLAQKDYSVRLKSLRKEMQDTYQNMTDDIFTVETLPRILDVKIVTPASFKRNNRYVIIPELYLIFQSLLHRWNEFNPHEIISSPGIEKELADVTEIIGYKLESKTFSVDGHNIYGFSGSLRLKLHGNDIQNRIIALLLIYGSFSGVGVKTALGMGLMNTKAAKMIK